MLVVCVGSLAGNLVAQLNKVFGELAKTANDHGKILPLNTIRQQFSEHRVAGVPGVQILGVLYKVLLDAPSPFFNRNTSTFTLKNYFYI